MDIKKMFKTCKDLYNMQYMDQESAEYHNIGHGIHALTFSLQHKEKVLGIFLYLDKDVNHHIRNKINISMPIHNTIVQFKNKDELDSNHRLYIMKTAGVLHSYTLSYDEVRDCVSISKTITEKDFHSN